MILIILSIFFSVVTGGLEGKYRVAAPELMQDTFMSDSEDEGGEFPTRTTLLDRYLTVRIVSVMFNTAT